MYALDDLVQPFNEICPQEMVVLEGVEVFFGDSQGGLKPGIIRKAGRGGTGNRVGGSSGAGGNGSGREHDNQP